MIPNVIAIVTKLEEIAGDATAITPFAKCLFLAIPYCCSVGGFSTLIGTPPNLILAQISRERFPRAPEIGFGQFIFVALPISWAIQICMYVYYYIVFLRNLKLPPNLDATLFRENYANLGPWKPAEKWILLLFGTLALLWFFRGDLNFGGSSGLTGWANTIFPKKGSGLISDGTVALLMSCLLFIIHVPQPSRREEEVMERHEVDLEIRRRRRRKSSSSTDDFEEVSEDSELREEQSEVVQRSEAPASESDDSTSKDWVPILEWDHVQLKIPWSILFLFSGGFVLNLGFQSSGLDLWLGNAMHGWTKIPLSALILLVMLITTVFSTFASNTACANIMLPIVAVLAQNSGTIHPWRLMFPTCFMTSCCFLLPVSTPPNLIAYGSGRLAMRDFLIHGGVFTVISLLIVWGMTSALMPAVFNAKEMPDWALPEVPAG
jgi:di/tricarboxylate transporter